MVGAEPDTASVGPYEDEGSNGRRAVLQLRGVRKTYGQVEALRGVDLELRRAEIHAVVGDNGAGKSTLLKIAAGTIQPDDGEIRFHGRKIALGSPVASRRMGIEVVYQDLALAEERSSVANVFIGREVVRRGLLGRLGVLDRKAMSARTLERFRQLSIPVEDVDRPVRLLSGGQRQGVAIARAAIWAREVVLMDEPTAALGVRQTEAVNDLVRGLRSNGFGVLLISHNVPEILAVADRVTVLRLGSHVATRAASDVDTEWVVQAMVGGKA